ncbi:hypothetical protein D3C87_1429120 [compost metagenome]
MRLSTRLLARYAATVRTSVAAVSLLRTPNWLLANESAWYGVVMPAAALRRSTCATAKSSGNSTLARGSASFSMASQCTSISPGMTAWPRRSITVAWAGTAAGAGSMAAMRPSSISRALSCSTRSGRTSVAWVR